MIAELRLSPVLNYYTLNTKTQESKYDDLTFEATQYLLYNSLRSLYQKFAKEGQEFIVRNTHFAIYFGKEEGKEICHLVPSQAMEQAVKDNGLLKYEVTKLFTDLGDKKIQT